MNQPSAISLIIELQFLPSLHYFSKLACYQNIYFEKWENYNKGSFRNKCLIKSNTSNQYLIVPLKKGKNQSRNIQDVYIAYDQDWPRSMEHKLQTEYGNFPYYTYYIDELISILQDRPAKLIDLNRNLMVYVFRAIGWNQMRWTERYIPKPESFIKDGRDKFTPRYWKSKPALACTYQLSYFKFTPGHSILEALFSYGPEVPLLIQLHKNMLSKNP